MLKTWDVQPEATADGHVAVRPPPSHEIGLPEAGGSSDSPALDFDRAVRIWGLLRRGAWTREETLRELKYLEAGLPACDSCRLRSATINDAGFHVCGACHKTGVRWMPTGDEIDRGWESYRDEVRP